MENLLVAVSNFAAVLPIWEAYEHGDSITLGIVGFVTVASFLSHLFENHKHGMPGILAVFQIHVHPKWSLLLNTLDVLGAVGTFFRFLYLLYLHPGALDISLCALVFVAFIILGISEYDMFNENLKLRYIFYHVHWHVLIFVSMDIFLENVYS
jgi:hypothetical protein